MRDRTLVKTWAMRGTLHWLPSDEYGTWLAALRDKERSVKRSAAWERYHGLGAAQLVAVTDAIGEVLGATPLTRDELAAAIGAHVRDPAVADAVRTSFGGSVLKVAAAEGYLCFGPSRDRNVTFLAPSAWLGPVPEVDAHEAKREVVRRFLRAWGPATADDLGRWWGVQSGAKKLLGTLGDEVVDVDVDGVPMAVLAADVDELRATAPAPGDVQLLPGFDTYVLGPRSHRIAAWPAGAADRISRPAGWISPTVLMGGRVVAVWRPQRAGDRTTIEVEALAPLAKAARATVARAAAAWEQPLGTAIDVQWVARIAFGSAAAPDS